MSKHFCCCIPVRAGVFFFSLLQFLYSAGIAGIFWFLLHLAVTGQTWQGLNYSNIGRTGEIAAGIVAGIYTILALIAFFGFLGSIARNRRMVKLYSVTTWIQVLVHIVASGFLLYFAYSDKNPCKESGKDCAFHFKTWQKIVYTITTVIGSFIFIWIASVIGKYVDQLYDEDYSHEYKLAKPTNASTYTPSYYPPQAQDAHQGLLNPGSAPYPYTDQAHSFGNTAHA